MGVVYRAKHEGDATPAALKVLSSRYARQEEFRADFRREVQALARLNHPSVATIYDYGRLGPNVDEQERGEGFAPGAPWFAMEYIDGEPFAEAALEGEYGELRSHMLSLLDGLAHAHASGVYHRDLKPSNIMIPADGSGATLVDFGIATLVGDSIDAHSIDAQEGAEGTEVRGTPRYMAPEQILGEWREYGPWTDLYALGCTIWAWLCGRAPFQGESSIATMKAHLDHEPSDFEPRIPVPGDFEAWLRRLIQRNVVDRFQCAADAAWNLLGVEGRTVEAVDAADSLSSADTRPSGTIDLWDTFGELPELDGAESVASVGTPMEVELPPVPPNWGRRDVQQPATLSASGLELFGLRRLPVVDRESERDVLWEQFRKARRTKRPRAVLLTGASGSGKTKLADWMTRRVEELGVARSLRIYHDRRGGSTEGLGAMFKRHFRLHGLDEVEATARVVEELVELGIDRSRALSDAANIIELAGIREDGSSQSGRSKPLKSLHVAARRVLEALADQRPLVLAIDDMARGPSSARFAAFLFDLWEQRTFPMLVVMTARATEWDEAAGIQEELAPVLEAPESAQVEVEPLADSDQRKVVEAMLQFDSEVVDRVVGRTEGHPLFAVQLVKDWVDRGFLESTEEGFRVREEARSAFPSDLRNIWERRLERVFEAYPAERHEAIRHALELGAALGRRVRRAEWRVLLDGADLEVPEALVDQLIDAGLAERWREGWAFTHGLLVESLESFARIAGRWEDHHRRCAMMLEELYSEHPARTAGRRAEHYLEAGMKGAAVEPLFDEADRVGETGRLEARERVLERRSELLDAVDVPRDDARRIENEIELLGVRLRLGAPPGEVLDALESRRIRAETVDADRLVARAQVIASACLRRQADFSAAVEAVKQATRRARKCGDRNMLADALLIRGWTEYNRGRLDLAEAKLSKSFQHAKRIESRTRLDAKRMLGAIAEARGETDEARRLHEEVLEESRANGFLADEMNALNELGEVARLEGEADRARKYYRRYSQLARELGHTTEVAIGTLNVAQVELMAERFEDAGDRLREAREHLEELSRDRERTQLLRVAELTRAAGLREWERFDAIMDQYGNGWPEEARLIPDHAWLAEMAGDYAARAGEEERAERAWRLGRTLWEKLESPDRVERVSEKLGG